MFLVLAAALADGEKDDDVDVQNLINASANLRQHIRKNLDPEAQKWSTG